MRKYYVFFLVLFTGVLGAQDLHIIQNTFYRDGINPASFAQANDFNVFILHNTQYVGFDESPNYQIIDASFYSGGNKLGLSIFNDALGVQHRMNFKLRYAKQFDISSKSFFSLGINAGATNNRFDPDKMVFENDDDPLKYIDHSNTKFDFDFGAEFQFSKLILGLSVNHLNTLMVDEEIVNQLSHFYGYAQMALFTNGSIHLYPNLVARVWNETFWMESGLLVFYKDLIWIGPGYSSSHDLSISTGIGFRNFKLGYAFRSNMDSEILSAWGANTHEIMLNIAFNHEKVNINTPRFID